LQLEAIEPDLAKEFGGSSFVRKSEISAGLLRLDCFFDKLLSFASPHFNWRVNGQ